jgi:hypothetical protein|nr:MAG TPA: hypothetical protein [Bacteriophage sp.]
MEKEKIELNAIYDSSLLSERYAKPFRKEISPYDFPDFTDKELVVKSKSEDGEDEALEFLSGDGKNIVAKLDFGLDEAVFKPYGTHESLGGLLYYCRDISINGSNGLFICILLNGLNEIWVGIDKIFFEEYPYYFDDPDSERCSRNWEYDEEDYYDDDGNYIINPWRNDRGRIDTILECEEFQILDMRNHDCAVVIYNNDIRVDIVPRESIRRVYSLEITQKEVKDILLDILSVEDIDISTYNEFICGDLTYNLSYIVEVSNRIYYVLEDKEHENRLVIESGIPSGPRIVK